MLQDYSGNPLIKEYLLLWQPAMCGWLGVRLEPAQVRWRGGGIPAAVFGWFSVSSLASWNSINVYVLPEVETPS